MADHDDDDDWKSAEVEQLDAGGAGSASAASTAAGSAPQQQQIHPSVYKKWICVYPCYLDPKKQVGEGRKLPLHLLVGCELIAPSLLRSRGGVCVRVLGGCREFQFFHLTLHLSAGDDPWIQEIAESVARVGFGQRPMVFEQKVGALCSELHGCCEVVMDPLLLESCVTLLGFLPQMHPRDWPKRSRFRVSLKDDAGEFVVPGIKSKKALLQAVAQVLPSSPFRQQRLAQQARQVEMERQQRAAAAAAAAAKPGAAAKSLKDAAKSAGGAAAAATASPAKAAKKKK
jgi:signal recognition particle subunit SEC65